MTDVHAAAINLTETQKRLLDLLAANLDPAESIETLNVSIIPRYGAMRDGDTIWGYSRHGDGIRFVNIRNLVCVDIESDIKRPERFTVWRLATFLRSMGDSVTADALDTGLMSLSDVAREVQPQSGVYELPAMH